MSLLTVIEAPRWSPVTTNKINGPLGKNVVLSETCDFGVAVKVLILFDLDISFSSLETFVDFSCIILKGFPVQFLMRLVQ